MESVSDGNSFDGGRSCCQGDCSRDHRIPSEQAQWELRALDFGSGNRPIGDTSMSLTQLDNRDTSISTGKTSRWQTAFKAIQTTRDHWGVASEGITICA